MSWNKLSMRDRAAYIKLGINNGITDLNTIREIYNKFEEGGTIDKGDSKDTIRYEPDIIVSDANSYIGTRLIEKSPGVYYDTISGKILHDYDKMPHATVTSYRNSSTGNTLSDITNNLQRAYAKGIPSGTMKADMEVANAISGGAFNLISPTQVIGATGRLISNGDSNKFGKNLILGNNGIVTDNFAKEHPYWSMAINSLADGITYKAPFKVKSMRPSKSVSSKAVSSLDWDPESLFRAGNNESYTPKDLEILRSHIPEYIEIERASKLNGTYLQMPDGSTYRGDPREWVIAQSKNVKENYSPEIYYHGDSNMYIDNTGKNVTGSVNGKKVLWTSTNYNIPYTYGNNRYAFILPENTKVNKAIDAKGRNWRAIDKDMDTNDFAYENLTDDGIIRINNVVDPGPLHYNKALPKPLKGESVPDYYSRVFIGDDIVFGKDVIRKSLLGNNGDFNPKSRDIFKLSIPAFLITKELEK